MGREQGEVLQFAVCGGGGLIMVMRDYVNIDTKPSWRKKAKSWSRKNKDPLLLVSLVLLASLVGGY